MAVQPVWLLDSLSALVRAKLAPEARVWGIAPLPGHAGLGFSFHAGVEDDARRYVVRTIADGVPATGPADVVRQARIMQSMAAHGVPTPEMIWFEGAPNVFGRPYFVGAFVEGEGLPDPAHVTPRHRRLVESGIRVMAKMHAIDPASVADAWGARTPLRAEFDRLHKLIDRDTISAAHIGRAHMLRERLLASAPENELSGCVHGDMHSGNMIFGEEDVRAVVDWEIAFIGPTLLDIGWIAFYADARAFIPEQAATTQRWVLTSDEMVDCYRSARGVTVPSRTIDWYRAFAAYRYGCITLFNEMLHRRGKRHDPLWSDVVKSAPLMMERGLELIA
jgi:aminoglycoside phosphotransferase (APT) family kinase protein